MREDSDKDYLPYLLSGPSLKQCFLARFGGGNHDGLGEWVGKREV